LTKGVLAILCNAVVNPQNTSERLLRYTHGGRLVGGKRDSGGKPGAVVAKESH
jgi:hypothetical protein